MNQMSNRSLLKGSIYMIIAFFFVALFGLFLKLSSQHTSSLWSTFIAYLFAFLIYTAYIFRKGVSFFFTHRIVGHICRAGFGVAATIFYVVAMATIPLLNATLLFNTTPLFVPIFALFFLHAKPSLRIWSSVLVGFVGVIFIIRPNVQILEYPGNLIGLLSGACLAVAFIFVKLLTTTEPRERILFYFFFFGTIFTAIFFPFFGAFPSIKAIYYGAIAGFFFVLCQEFIVKSYEHAEAHEVGAFQYTSVVFAGLFDWFFGINAWLHGFDRRNFGYHRWNPSSSSKKMNQQIAKWIIFTGLGIVLLGVLFWLLTKFGIPLGKLPGDITIKKEKISVYFPIVTSIILSIVLTILINVLFWIFRR